MPCTGCLQYRNAALSANPEAVGDLAKLTVPPQDSLRSIWHGKPIMDQLNIEIEGVCYGFCFMPVLTALVLGMGPANPHISWRKRVFISATGVPGTKTMWGGMSAKLRTWTATRTGCSWNGKSDPAAGQGAVTGQKAITDFFSLSKKAKKA